MPKGIHPNSLANLKRTPGPARPKGSKSLAYSVRGLVAGELNLVFSLLYNVLGVALAMAGLLNPLVAAVLMPVSSLTVIVSSYRARTFGAPVPEAAPWR